MNLKSRSFVQKVLTILTLVFLTACSEDAVDVSTSIHGIVSNSQTGQTIGGAEVCLMPIGKTIVSGHDGSFYFNDLEAGQYTLLVKKEGFEDGRKTVTTIAGQDTKADIALSPSVKKSEFEISSSVLSFTTEVTTLSFDIRNTGDADLDWNIAYAPDWLTVTPSQGTINGGFSTSVVVKANLAKQTTSTSDIILINTNAGSTKLTVNLTIEDRDAFSLSRNSLNFGTDVDEITFNITNTYGKAIEWSGVNLPTWLKLTPSKGTLNNNEMVSVVAKVDRSKLTSSATEVIVIQSGNFQKAITVSVVYEEHDAFTLSSTTLDFGSDIDEISFAITNTYGKSIEWVSVNLPTWLTFTPSKGTLASKGVVTVVAKVDRNKLTSTTSRAVVIQSGEFQVAMTVNVTKVDTGGGNTGGGNTGGGNTGGGSTTHDFSKVKIQSCSNDLLFTVTECERTLTGDVVLSFSVKNLSSQSLNLDMRGGTQYKGVRTYAYDNIGNCYCITGIKIGSASSTSTYTTSAQSTIPAGVTVKGSLTMSGVSDSATMFDNVTVWTYKPTAGNSLIINNVPIY